MKKLILALFITIGIFGFAFGQQPIFQSILTFDNSVDMTNYNYAWLDDSPGLAFVWADSTFYFWSSNTSSWENVNPDQDSLLYVMGNGDPRGVTTPDYIAQHYLDTANNVFYIADSLASTDWEQDVIIRNGDIFYLGNVPVDGATTVDAAQDNYVLKYDHATGKMGLEPDAGASGNTNLSLTTKTATTFDIESDTGTNVTLPESTNTEAGLMGAVQDVKLDGIETNATGDQALTGAYGITASATGGGDYTIEADTSEVVTPFDISGFLSVEVDGSTSNEIQDLTLVGNTLAITLDPTADVDLSGYLDNTNLTQEQVEDYAGALIQNATGTHIGLSVTYQDATGDIDFTVDHDAATNFLATEHRIINDAATSTTELWSADKISSELGIVASGGEVNTMAMIGTASGEDLYHSKVTAELKIKGIDSLNTGITISSDGDDVLIGLANHPTSYITDFALDVGNTASVSANTTHKLSVGTDHGYIDQDITSGTSPVFDGNNFTGIDADNVDIADAGLYYVSTEVEAALQEIRPLINLNTAKISYPSGATANATELNILDGAVLTTAELNKLNGVTATTTEINYIDGVSGPIQNQLNNKLGDVVEDLTPQLGGNLDLQTFNIEGVDATEISILDGAVLSTTEINYVNGVTSSVQTQLNIKLANVLEDLTPQLGGNLDLNGNNLDNVSAVELATLDGIASSTAELNVLNGIPGTLTATELGYSDGVTSGIQAQLDLKAVIADPTFTGEIGIGVVNISETELGILEGATLTTVELNYVDGVTSNIQTQLDAKNNNTLSINSKATDYTITSSDNGKVFYTTGNATYTLPTPSAGLHFILISDTSAKTMKVTCETPASETINSIIGSTSGINVFFQSSTTGASAEIIGINSTTWYVRYYTGTWTIP